MKEIYLIMLVNRQTLKEDVMDAVDGDIHHASSRMNDFVRGNNFDLSTFYCYLKKVNCFCDRNL